MPPRHENGSVRRTGDDASRKPWQIGEDIGRSEVDPAGGRAHRLARPRNHRAEVNAMWLRLQALEIPSVGAFAVTVAERTDPDFPVRDPARPS